MVDVIVPIYNAYDYVENVLIALLSLQILVKIV